MNASSVFCGSMKIELKSAGEIKVSSEEVVVGYSYQVDETGKGPLSNVTMFYCTALPFSRRSALL